MVHGTQAKFTPSAVQKSMCICQAKRHNFKLPQTPPPRGNTVFSLSDCSISISLGRKRNLIFGTSALRCRCGEEGMNLPWRRLSISDNPHKIGCPVYFFTKATAETQGLHKRSIYDTPLFYFRGYLCSFSFLRYGSVRVG